jgi:hypothetical protein
MSETQSASTGRGKSRANAITGIITGVLVPQLMFDAIKAQDLDVPHADTTPEQLSMVLFTHFSTLPKETLTRCTNCHGISDENLDACPYCGGLDGNPLVDPESDKKEAQTMTTEVHQEPAHATTNGQALTKVKGGKVAKSTRSESELNDSVAKIHRLKSEGAAALWAVGVEIAHVYKEQLWKLRVNTDDAKKERPRWSSFEAFCKEEIGMTPQNARSLMDVANHYKETDVRKFGTTKLGLILTAPPEDRAALEKKAAKGASKRELAKEVQKAKKNKGYVRAERSGKTQTKAARAAAANTKKAAPDKTITIAKIVGSEIVKLYEKPASMKGVDAESIKKLARAKKIGDGAIGMRELANDVIEFFNVFQTPGGELAVKVVTERDKS